MGFEEFIENTNTGENRHGYRSYPDHKLDDELYEMFNDLNSRFPVDVEVDFIEVSTRIENYAAKAYYRDGGDAIFIRFSENYIDSAPEAEIRNVMLHEMVHIYTYQMGHKGVGDGSHIFKWLCGAVGTTINQVPTESDKWEDLALPFVKEKAIEGLEEGYEEMDDD